LPGLGLAMVFVVAAVAVETVAAWILFVFVEEMMKQYQWKRQDDYVKQLVSVVLDLRPIQRA